MSKLWAMMLLELRLSLRSPQAWVSALGIPVVLLVFNGSIVAKGNPQLVAALVPGSLAVSALASGLFGTAIPLVNLRERGMLRRFRLAPITPRTVIVAFAAAHVALAMLGFAFCWGTAIFFFHAPAPQLLAQLGIYLVGATCFVAAGLIVGSVSGSTPAAAGTSNMIFLPMMLLSGATFPLQMMPHGLQAFARFLPSGYLVIALRRLIEGAAPASVIFPAAVLAVSAGLLLVADFNLFRWEPGEKISRGKLLAAIAAGLAPMLIAGFK